MPVSPGFTRSAACVVSLETVTGRLLFICHGSTEATRRTRFALDEPLEQVALRDAAELAERLRLPADRQCRTGPTQRCLQTAEALGLTGEPDAGLADWDLGLWAGRALDEVAVEEPDAVQAWLTDPTAAPHGGESLTDLLRRVAAWLDDVPRAGRSVAVTGPATVRAAMIHALRAPVESFWRIDVAPLATVDLRGRAGDWRWHA